MAEDGSWYQETMMMQVTIYVKLTKKLCIEEIDNLSLSSLMASRLLRLNKNPGLRPIGVGEVLRRLMGKVMMNTISEDVTTASSDAQMCGRSSGSEAAIHAMRRMFQHENSDTIIIIITFILLKKK